MTRAASNRVLCMEKECRHPRNRHDDKRCRALRRGRTDQDVIECPCTGWRRKAKQRPWLRHKPAYMGKVVPLDRLFSFPRRGTKGAKRWTARLDPDTKSTPIGTD